jgi:hypothetical protein
VALALAADADLRASPAEIPRDGRAAALALGASVAVHVALAAVAALAIGGSGGGWQAPTETVLRATLAAPPRKFTAPEPVAPPPPPAPRSVASAAPLPRAPVVAPVAVPRVTPSQRSGEGRVIVQIAEPEVPPTGEMLASLNAHHPGAARIVPEFEVEPAGTYPEAALAERRQFGAEIVAIVHADGRLEVVQGTFEDPTFRDSVRAAVAAAKARPPEVDGKAVAGWTLLRFYFEFVGSDAAGAAPVPAR